MAEVLLFHHAQGQTEGYAGGLCSQPGSTGAIYKTTNGGDTWSRVYSGNVGFGLAVDPARPSTIYAALDGGLARIARSTDGGRTWQTAG